MLPVCVLTSWFLTCLLLLLHLPALRPAGQTVEQPHAIPTLLFRSSPPGAALTSMGLLAHLVQNLPLGPHPTGTPCVLLTLS